MTFDSSFGEAELREVRGLLELGREVLHQPPGTLCHLLKHQDRVQTAMQDLGDSMRGAIGATGTAASAGLIRISP